MQKENSQENFWRKTDRTGVGAKDECRIVGIADGSFFSQNWKNAVDRTFIKNARRQDWKIVEGRPRKQ